MCQIEAKEAGMKVNCESVQYNFFWKITQTRKLVVKKGSDKIVAGRTNVISIVQTCQLWNRPERQDPYICQNVEFWERLAYQTYDFLVLPSRLHELEDMKSAFYAGKDVSLTELPSCQVLKQHGDPWAQLEVVHSRGLVRDCNPRVPLCNTRKNFAGANMS